MWDTISKAIDIIVSIWKFLMGLTKRNKQDSTIDADRRLADAIKRGDGQKVGEEWKKRKFYPLSIKKHPRKKKSKKSKV